MKKKEGQYYYEPHRSKWGIWRHHVSSDGTELGTFIKDCFTREEARKEVYRLNGWKLK